MQDFKISASYILVLVETLASFGVTKEQFCTELVPLVPADILQTIVSESAIGEIPLNCIEALISVAIRLSNEPGLAFYLAMHMKLSSHGFVGFAAMSAKNVREALEIAEQFSLLRVPIVKILTDIGDYEVCLTLEHDIPQGNMRDFFIITVFYGLLAAAEMITGVSIRGKAQTTCAEPHYFYRFKHLIPGEVEFNCRQDRLFFKTEVLDLPLKMYDPVSMQLAKEHCEQALHSFNASGRFIVKVKQLITSTDQGFLTLEQVAECLHMSSRTLKRQIAAHGATTFSELLEEIKRQKALHILEQDKVTIERLTELLGYSDVANFSRAFKKWTGQTPSAYRDQFRVRRGGG